MVRHGQVDVASLTNPIDNSTERSAIALNAQRTTDGAEALASADVITGKPFRHTTERSAIALNAH